MTQTSYPFDAGAGASVLEGQWQKMARHWLGTGVIGGYLNRLAVSADGVSLAVSVASGGAWVEGFYFDNDAAASLTVTTAHATLPRIDTVAVRLDRTANTATLVVIAGTAAASPVAPTLSVTDTLYEMPLANVAVGAAVGVISSGNLTDRRGYTFSQPAPVRKRFASVANVSLAASNSGDSSTTATFTPTVTGRYLYTIGTNVRFTVAGSLTADALLLYDSGSGFTAGTADTSPHAMTTDGYVQCSGYIDMTAATTYTLKVRNITGAGTGTVTFEYQHVDIGLGQLAG